MTMVPEHVVDLWRIKAEQYLARQRAHHELNKGWGPHSGDDIQACWGCGRQRAICSGKLRYEFIEEAWLHCTDSYANSDKLLVPYRCFWAEGLHWHVKTAKTSSERKKSRKRARRLARPNIPA